MSIRNKADLEPTPDFLLPASPLGAYYATAQQLVGETSSHDLGVLDRVAIQRYALTVGLTNPVHLDLAAARAAGYPDLVAPPNFLAAMFEWGPGTPESNLEPDGTPPSRGAGSTKLRGMGAGEEMGLVAPAVAGQRIVLEECISQVVAKDTRSGPCVFVTTAHTFRTADGAVLNRNMRTVVLRNPYEE